MQSWAPGAEQTLPSHSSLLVTSGFLSLQTWQQTISCNTVVTLLQTWILSLAHGPARTGWLVSCPLCHTPQAQGQAVWHQVPPKLLTYPSFIPPQHGHGCWVLPGPSVSWTQHPTGTSPRQGAATGPPGPHQGKQTQSLAMHPARDGAQGTWLPTGCVVGKLPLGKVFPLPATLQVSLEQGGTCQHCSIPWATSQGVMRWSCGIWESPARAMCSPPTALPMAGDLVGAWQGCVAQTTLSRGPFPAE